MYVGFLEKLSRQRRAKIRPYRCRYRLCSFCILVHCSALVELNLPRSPSRSFSGRRHFICHARLHSIPSNQCPDSVMPSHLPCKASRTATAALNFNPQRFTLIPVKSRPDAAAPTQRRHEAYTNAHPSSTLSWFARFRHRLSLPDALCRPPLVQQIALHWRPPSSSLLFSFRRFFFLFLLFLLYVCVGAFPRFSG